MAFTPWMKANNTVSGFYSYVAAFLPPNHFVSEFLYPLAGLEPYKKCTVIVRWATTTVHHKKLHNSKNVFIISITTTYSPSNTPQFVPHL
jgi:hypothetical protein